LENGTLKASYIFDSTNRMVEAVTGKGTANYTYNGFLKRIKSLENIQNAGASIPEPIKELRYILDMTRPYNDLLATDGTENQRFIWGNELLAAEGENSLSYLNDHLGSPIRLLGNEQEETFAYDEFGVPSVGAGTKLHNPFGFTGYQKDNISGLYFAQARYYSPYNARFVSEDPIKAQSNWYGYCGNSPLNYLDPMGLDAIVINKPVGFDPTNTIEHMSLLIQDSNGDWNYFFYGNQVYYDKITDPHAMDSLDNLNQYLLENNSSYGQPYLNNDKKVYTRSVYIEGDFTDTEAAAKKLVNSYIRDYKRKGKYKFNWNYGLISNNCTRNSIEILLKGKLPDEAILEDYLLKKGYFGDKDIDKYFYPNDNLDILQAAFNNSDFTTCE
jgi:RHS repeat-associated protein